MLSLLVFDFHYIYGTYLVQIERKHNESLRCHTFKVGKLVVTVL